MAIVGIDLGTTNSLIAHYKEGQVHIIPNRLQGILTPSVVSLLGGEITIGDTAKEIQAKNPGYCASAFKRFIGTEKRYDLNGQYLSSVDLSSFILKSLIEDAEAYIGEKVEEAIISVPAYFNDQQRKATIQAARLANIKVERLINEPTAAAIAYQMHDKNDETVLAIVDLGGGTFDVSILDIFDSIIEVRAVAGDNYLGGEDFDEAIMQYIIKELDLQDHQLTTDVRAQIKYATENAKKGLSENPSVVVKLVIEEAEYKLTLNEETLEKILTPLIEKLRAPLKKAITDSDFKVSEIDEVILVGGSTRMPLVKRFVAKLFNRFPMCHLNPDEVVVRGAAIAAAMKAMDKDFEDTVLTDVCPYTLGLAVNNTLPNGVETIVYDPIIERNMTVPTSIIRQYTNARDDQAEVVVKVFQGESRNLSDNLNLGMLELKLPKASQNTVIIDVRFTYDINGILEVEAKIDQTGEYAKQIMINANNLSDEEVHEHMKALAKLKIHPRDQEVHKHLISKGERLFEITLGDLRKQIDLETNMFLSILEKQNKEDIKQAKKRYEDFIAYVESML